ncbi:DNA repair protein RadA [Candidatus Gracilibacteria bacterium]|nr:DNA repair protein RadA [Candidatus Gracilibacteria bacterium]
MGKSAENFLCTECGDTFSKWVGKCPSCNEWNTLKEFRESKAVGGKSKTKGKNLTQVEALKPPKQTELVERFSSGIEEFDRVTGKIFPGSFILFGGSPGVGKSTLALQIFLNIKGAMYFSGEESAEQVFHRASRLETRLIASLQNNIFSTNSLEDIVETIERNSPPFAIVDSIQMVGLENSSLGQISQIKENAEILLRLAKSTGTTILIIGHVTKNEEIAGPKILEHIVDTVLQLEGEENSGIRILRSPKNRFGSTLEVGVFEMTSTGLRELANPSEFFLAERAENSFGSAITVVREGSRNFLMEIQVLTVQTNFGLPRRTSHGMDLSKFHLMLAVISKFTPFKCETFDAYLNIIGGLRIKEPSADLAVVAAILSSRAEKEIPAHTIILGEVGLSGEIRSVAYLESRLLEAEKLGFKRAIVPRIREKFEKPKRMQVVEVKSVLELMKEILREN